MHDPRRMSLGQTVGCLRGQGQQAAQRKRADSEQLPKRLALHQLHRDVGHRVRRVDVVDRHDVGMIERGGRARLLLEALQSVGIGGDLAREHLDRDIAREPHVPRPPNLSHAP